MTTPSFKTSTVREVVRSGQRGGSLVSPSAERTAVAAGKRRRTWLRAVRVARDVILGFGFIAAIPLTVIGLSDRSWGVNDEGIRPRLVELERLRPLSVEIDASISPEAAGAALRRLLPLAATPAFPLPAEYFNSEPWKASAPADVFSILRSAEWKGPEPSFIVQQAAPASFGAPNPFSRAEQEWLKTVATSPIWKDFDVVARASHVDMLSDRFNVASRDEAWPGPIPIPSFIEARLLAFAGVSRAAYYVSIGDTARGVNVLRTTMSFGFAMLDDGITTVESLMGRVIVDAARDGLYQLNVINWSKVEDQILVQPFGSRIPVMSLRQNESSVAMVQAAAVRNVLDATLPRSFRFDQLSTLALSTCGSVRSVVLGPSSAVQQAFDEARRSLAQSEAEREYIDLLERNGSAMPVRPMQWSVAFQVVQGAAVVTSTVLNNPRIASCTRAVIGDFASRQDK